MNVKLTEAQKKTEASNADSIAAIMQQILKRENRLGRSQEHFWVVGLNQANKILFIELIGLGRQNRVSANPPDVFRMAIYKLALKLVLVHNHPSGQMLPSTADKALTDRIIKVGEIINVQVLDHIIIAENDHISFDQLGIMDQLRASDTWRVIEKDQLEVQEWKQKMEAKRIEHEKALAIAKQLKAMGLNEGAIKKATKLKISDIRTL